MSGTTALSSAQWKQLKRAAKETGENGQGAGAFIWDAREDRVFRALEDQGLVHLVEMGFRAKTTPTGFERFRAGRAEQSAGAA